MPTIVVDVMPKAELLDPQGKAVAGALGRMGIDTFSGVRIGKRFELTVEGQVTDEVLAEARRMCEAWDEDAPACAPSLKATAAGRAA